MPRSFIESVVIPLVKNRNGDLTDVNNYRAITIANVETKVFETILLSKIRSTDSSDMHQFSFKQGLSTGLCTSVVKRTIDYYINRGSHIFSCFIYFNKPFDTVNYWKLFSHSHMLDDGVDTCYIRLGFLVF